MRNRLAMITAVCVGSALIGCNSNSTPAKKVVQEPKKQPQQLSWTLKLQAKCNGATAQECVGAHGFTVYQDGHYFVGPGPQNEYRTGQLEANEWNEINAALANTLSSSSAEAAENHLENYSMPGDDPTAPNAPSEDSVTLNRGQGADELLFLASGSNLAFKVKSADDAKAIHKAIRNLAMKYAYQFPDACLDEANLVENQFAAMRFCAADADCGYFNESFEPATAGQYGPLVVADDGGIIKPLAVGNKVKVEAEKANLLDKMGHLQNTCGATLNSQRRGFDGVGVNYDLNSAPVCRQNLCQAGALYQPQAQPQVQPQLQPQLQQPQLQPRVQPQ